MAISPVSKAMNAAATASFYKDATRSGNCKNSVGCAVTALRILANSASGRRELRHTADWRQKRLSQHHPVCDNENQSPADMKLIALSYFSVPNLSIIPRRVDLATARTTESLSTDKLWTEGERHF
jgi:hypothetical protein